MATRKKAAPVAAPARRGIATPTLRGRIGPDLSSGYLNPEREGKVLAAIRSGLGGGTTRGIVEATGLRTPTVTYFAKEASAGGSAAKPLIEIVSVGGTSYFVPLSTDRLATAGGKKVRSLALALRDAGKAPAKATRKARAPKAPKAPESGVGAGAGAEEGGAE